MHKHLHINDLDWIHEAFQHAFKAKLTANHANEFIFSEIISKWKGQFLYYSVIHVLIKISIWGFDMFMHLQNF